MKASNELKGLIGLNKVRIALPFSFNRLTQLTHLTSPRS
jgi:hypothetical protein